MQTKSSYSLLQYKLYIVYSLVKYIIINIIIIKNFRK